MTTELCPTTCRFCLACDVTTRCFFEAFSSEKQQQLQALLGIEILPSDEYSNVCTECENNIGFVHSIVKGIQSVNKLFHALRYVNKLQQNDVNDAKSLNGSEGPSLSIAPDIKIERFDSSDEEYLYEFDDGSQDEADNTVEANDQDPKQKCFICNSYLDPNLPLRNHHESHHEYVVVPSRCEKCWIKLVNIYDWNDHLRDHHFPFGCLYCAKVFESQTASEQHRNNCAGYRCGGCNQSFAFLHQLLKHNSCEAEDDQRVQNVCHLLNTENQVEEQNEPSKCLICNEECKGNDELYQHIEDTHADLDVKLHQCDRCLKHFFSLNGVRQHRASHTKRTFRPNPKTSQCHSKGPNECFICRAEFKFNRNLLKHLETAHAEVSVKLFRCLLCNHKFTTKAKMEKHKYNTHQKRQPRYCCSYCGRTFNKRLMLVDHENVHRGLKTYHCSPCSRDFMYKSSYDRHMQVVHSDTKNFTCEFCHKSFKRSTTLTVHMRLHTGEKPYVCGFCGRQFTDASSFRKHKLKEHTDGSG
uniref:C2H2-type domain-containing protein n=1 Tax=Anopheles christyi TaxID=43041 RepID=A0A182JR55_9DIPT